MTQLVDGKSPEAKPGKMSRYDFIKVLGAGLIVIASSACGSTPNFQRSSSGEVEMVDIKEFEIQQLREEGKKLYLSETEISSLEIIYREMPRKPEDLFQQASFLSVFSGILVSGVTYNTDPAVITPEMSTLGNNIKGRLQTLNVVLKEAILNYNTVYDKKLVDARIKAALATYEAVNVGKVGVDIKVLLVPINNRSINTQLASIGVINPDKPGKVFLREPTVVKIPPNSSAGGRNPVMFENGCGDGIVEVDIADLQEVRIGRESRVKFKTINSAIGEETGTAILIELRNGKQVMAPRNLFQTRNGSLLGKIGGRSEIVEIPHSLVRHGLSPKDISEIFIDGFFDKSNASVLTYIEGSNKNIASVLMRAKDGRHFKLVFWTDKLENIQNGKITEDMVITGYELSNRGIVVEKLINLLETKIGRSKIFVSDLFSKVARYRPLSLKVYSKDTLGVIGKLGKVFSKVNGLKIFKSVASGVAINYSMLILTEITVKSEVYTKFWTTYITNLIDKRALFQPESFSKLGKGIYSKIGTSYTIKASDIKALLTNTEGGNTIRPIQPLFWGAPLDFYNFYERIKDAPMDSSGDKPNFKRTVLFLKEKLEYAKGPNLIGHEKAKEAQSKLERFVGIANSINIGTLPFDFVLKDNEVYIKADGELIKDIEFDNPVIDYESMLDENKLDEFLTHLDKISSGETTNLEVIKAQYLLAELMEKYSQSYRISVTIKDNNIKLTSQKLEQ